MDSLKSLEDTYDGVLNGGNFGMILEMQHCNMKRYRRCNMERYKDTNENYYVKFSINFSDLHDEIFFSTVHDFIKNKIISPELILQTSDIVVNNFDVIYKCLTGLNNLEFLTLKCFDANIPMDYSIIATLQKLEKLIIVYQFI